eukprot:TRINITY_DN4800_c0_g1_i1.p1 TRINITY_DN4800_c0_g1~~TRINITY_DN4800_c0_g1_i1.p1  ORF type:complete len:261 (+),score=43.72 TRINITY_DN4800_c0_g1_i1:152-934(+)
MKSHHCVIISLPNAIKVNAAAEHKHDSHGKCIEQRRHWDLFYKRNTTNFFKDRNWLTREFPELSTEQPSRLLEIGCGVGNTIFPLSQVNPKLFCYACDLSPRAVELVKANELYTEERFEAFQCDLTKDALAPPIPEASLDFITAFFVFSALSLAQMETALTSMIKVIKPGGLVLLRDYGVNDHSMVRFKKGHKLGDRFYMRQDGTRTYFLTLDETREMFEKHGFEVDRLGYLARRTVNEKEAIDVARCFVQGVFRYRPEG